VCGSSLTPRPAHGRGMRCAQVLPTCSLQTLVLSTNSVGDKGCELLAQSLSGAQPSPPRSLLPFFPSFRSPPMDCRGWK
jgi:hypothetical protein